ncbi:methionyl-tRNA formyltransferase [Candidatus Falkowbacteria bacterium]|jgi:methionyl-tRNA formyltransferase|nr:methionyl-tRNA formyltransferase [Candidatus Falkowbacteria bacterium]MBT4433288.1 methionyl-tRNA formyltransferase [Candidatus Falkowbacteria bacterium]
MSSDLKNLIKTKKSETEKKDKRGPRTAHQFLAVDIAESFGKIKSRRDVAVLMNICKKYPDIFVRRVWGIVKEKNIGNKMAYFLAIIKNMNEEEKQEKLRNLKIIFIGTSNFAVPALQKLKENNFNIISVITQPDKPIGRKKILTPPPIKNKALEYNLPVLQPTQISEFTERIKQLNPDLIVMVSYGQIIPKEIIDIPNYGTLNIHPSILPKYRGSSPIQSAILNQDKQTGVTVMLVDEKMDHGPILSTKRVKTYNRDYSTLHNELAELGAILLLKVISQHITGQLSAKEQNHKKTTFTKILERDDGKIDWSKKVEKIEAQIRAYRPWPGTWCYTDSSKKIKIIKATINETESKNKNFGKIINSPANGKMIVLCKKGSLVIEELQLEGKNKITGEEFLRGNNNIITLV